MGRIYEVPGGRYHEGYPVGIREDGSEVSGWGGPSPEIVAAQPACDCGWRGTPIPIAELADRCGLDVVTHLDLIEWDEGEPGGVVLEQWETEHVAPMSWRAALAAADSRARSAQDALVRAVRDARSHGASWTDVGTVLHVSKQAAHERFARAVDQLTETDSPDRRR